MLPRISTSANNCHFKSVFNVLHQGQCCAFRLALRARESAPELVTASRTLLRARWGGRCFSSHLPTFVGVILGCTGGFDRDSRSHLLMGIQARRIGSARGLFGAGRVGPSVVLPFLLEPRSAPPVLSPASMVRGRRREVPCPSLLTPCRAPPVLLPAVFGVRVGACTPRPFDGYFFFDVTLSSVCLHPERCRS